MGLRVWPSECDAAFPGHAALMVLMECGRIDLMVRFGFLRLARRSRRYLPLVTRFAVTVQALIDAGSGRSEAGRWSCRAAAQAAVT
jgi:hypothetical protein